MRYAGKPLLRVLELYVLDAIDRVTPDDRQLLADLTPTLRETYAVSGTWQEVLEAALSLPPGLPAAFRDLWADQPPGVDPEQFARAVVDENFDTA